MPKGPANALQKALVAHLRADPAVAALVGGRIYDEAPELATRPFIQIGQIAVRPARVDGATDWDVTFAIEAHSRPVTAGRVEATEVIEAVVTALEDASLAPEGFTAPWCWFATQTVVRDDDGKSYTAVAAFDAALEPVP